MPHASRSERKALPFEGGAKEPDSPSVRLWAKEWLVCLSLFLAVSAAATVFVAFPFAFSPPVYSPGDIARADVKAARDFLVPDPDATEKKRMEAETAFPVIYDHNPGVLGETLASLNQDFQRLEAQPRTPEAPRASDGEGVIEAFENRWKVPVPKAVARRLADPEGAKALEAAVAAHLKPLYDRGVVGNKRVLRGELRRGVLVRNLVTREEAPLIDLSTVDDFNDARKALANGPEPDALKAFARQLAGALLRPNLNFNSEETGARRTAAREAVNPVLYQVRKGEMLVRGGDRVSAEQARRLEIHGQVARGTTPWRGYAALFSVATLSLWAAYRFGRGNVKKFRGSTRDMVFVSALLVATFAMERAGLMLVSGLAGAVPASVQTALAYALPVSSVGIVLRVVLNSETALVFAIPGMALAALPFEHSLAAFFCFVLGGLTGAHKAARACRRMDFLRAGVWAGVVQAATAGSFSVLEGAGGAWWASAGAFLGGTIGGVVALCLVPVAEWALGYTTETRLTELASMDHPLLRQLVLRAPGTYYHSIMTGSLVKAAAEAIGARALLATVAAYYHDIGKLSKPIYYIENQTDGSNPHDRLAPSMSSLILTSHVKEGVELARRHRLGRDIEEIVRQHHGTSVIRFFYEKACQNAREGVDSVSESEYRYPGPKPQTREAGLVLLADAVEAAVRTIPDPKPARIRGAVQTIVNRTFTDGQLDECDLTLKDLHQIAHSFCRILSAIHHQRIDYPLAVQKRKTSDGDLDTKRMRGSLDRRREAAPAGSESLRRLGM